jgi:isopenicillin-N N-acyltransferase-like protein
MQSLTSSTRFPEITVSGDPREMGRQLGEAAGEQIRAFCDVALERVNKTVRVSVAAAKAVASECIPYAESYSPEMVEELGGTAEAARVPLEDLMLLQVRNQLHAVADAGCTSLASEGLVAQNWDNDPALDPLTIVLTRRPKGKPALMTVTQAGLIGYIGFNEAGIGLCLNTLPAPSRRVGVPHYFTVRGILEASSLDEAVTAVRRANRAIPANIMTLTPQGPADLEVTLEDVRVLRDEGAGGVTHTNHCQHEELLGINREFPELIQSHARKRRIDELLALDRGRLPTLQDVQTALRDHDGYPRSICRHTNDDPGTGFWQTIFSVVIEPSARRMHVSRGTPCNRPYETYELA